MKIRKGDIVYIAKGKDRGKTGKVVLAKTKESKLIVQGLNLYKKSLKPKKEGEKGQIISVPRPIQTANVRLVCGNCGKKTKIGYRIIEQGKRRYCKKCQSVF